MDTWNMTSIKNYITIKRARDLDQRETFVDIVVNELFEKSSEFIEGYF